MYNSEAIQQAYENNQWIDWIDEATQGNASQKDVNLSIRGGSDKIKVYSSLAITIRKVCFLMKSDALRNEV